MKRFFALLAVATVYTASVASASDALHGDADMPVVRVSAILTRANGQTGQLSVTADIKKGIQTWRPDYFRI